MYLLWTRLTYILFIRNEMTILGHQELGTRERNILCLLLFSMKSIAEQRSDMTCVVLHLFLPRMGLFWQFVCSRTSLVGMAHLVLGSEGRSRLPAALARVL